MTLRSNWNNEMSMLNRATRLGEFSPIGRSFTLWQNKITELAQLFGGYFFPKYRLSINFDKKLIGLRFGRFFQKLIWSPWCAEADAQNCWKPKMKLSRQSIKAFM
jgi:hypothetical protein